MAVRRPAWKVLCAAGAALLLLIALFFTWVQAVAARRWDALQKRVPLLIAEARARDPRRPALRGEAVPGKAWDDYGKALAPLKGIKHVDLGAYVGRHVNADRSKAVAVLTANEGVLALLTSGAGKSDGVYPLNFERGFAADIPGLLQSQNLGNLAILKARLLAEAGKGREAVELLLDAAQFGADMGRNSLLISEMISLAILALVFEEIRNLVLNPGDLGVDWTDLGRALALLDAHFPDHAQSLLNELACSAAGLAGPEATGFNAFEGGGLSSALAWRYGFSSRIMIVDAVETKERLMRRGADACRLSWDEASRDSKEAESELMNARNPVVRILVPGLLSSFRVGFERRAQLRLLRAAVAWRASGDPGTFDDPFGGKLRFDGAKLWSLGSDAADGGGVGAWKPDRKGDIVLELPKK